MKRLKAGPELKMPELKVPDFLVDLYWDLRDRHLLPLVGLAIVALVALPFLLGGSEDSHPAPVAIGSPPSPETAGSSLNVVEAKPGLRDYRKRLRDDSSTDPFVQRFTGPVLKGAKLGGGGEATSSTTSTSTSTTETTKTESPSGSTATHVTTETNGEPAPGGTGSGNPKLQLFSFAIDVKIVRTQTKADGSKQTDDPVIRHRVIPPAALPGEKAQVVTYMGISPKTRQPLLLVSDAVTSVFGEASCLSGASTCQLIEVETGMPMTFVYGPGSVRYKFTVLKVEPVVVGNS
jgi:hypothetical protein